MSQAIVFMRGLRAASTTAIVLVGTLFVSSRPAAAVEIDFEIGSHASVLSDQYRDRGVTFEDAIIFQGGINSWLRPRSGIRGMTVSSNPATVNFLNPTTGEPAPITGFSIGYGYDSDGGERPQTIGIKAFNRAGAALLDFTEENVFNPNDYYRTFSTLGATRLELTAIGGVGFDDLSFTLACPVAPITKHVPGEQYDPEQLTEEMRDAIDTFQEKLRVRTNGMQLVPTSGFRTQALQDHFVQIAVTFAALAQFGNGIDREFSGQNNDVVHLIAAPNSQAEAVCGDIVMQVNNEIDWHGLGNNGDGFLAVNRNSNHPSRNAVDFSRNSVYAIADKLSVKEVRDLAKMSHLKWLWPRDKVHFQYDGTLANTDFYTGDLTEWIPQGNVEVVGRSENSGDYFAKLTAASDAGISQSFDVPLQKTDITVDVMFPSKTGILGVLIDSQLIGQLGAGAIPDDGFSQFSVRVPQNLLGQTGVQLEFLFQGPSGASVLLDNIGVSAVPEPSCFGLFALGGAIVLGLRRLRKIEQMPLALPAGWRSQRIAGAD